MFFSHMSDMWEKIRAVEGLGHRFFSACPKCDALAGGLKKPANLTDSVHLSRFDYKTLKVLRKLQVFAFSPASRRRAPAFKSSP